MTSEPSNTNGERPGKIEQSGNANGPASGDGLPKARPFRRVIVHIERTLMAGLLVMLPIGITLLVLKFIFDLLDPILDPAMDLLPGPEITGAGLLALIILIYIVGLVAAFVLGRRIISMGHRILEFIPVVKGIYSTTRSAVQLLSTGQNGQRGYDGVVLIEFPRPGIRAIGLITSRIVDAEGEEMLSIYIPTTPIPSSGFLVMAPVREVTSVDMSVEDAMSVIISGGILTERVFQRSGSGVPPNPSSNQ